MKITALGGYKPHPSHRGWKNFLKNSCEVRGEEDGVVYYGSTNCNYLLFQDGTLVLSYGFHGQAQMNRIKEQGARQVLQEIREKHDQWTREVDALLERLAAHSRS
jgi:hypothetical protein